MTYVIGPITDIEVARYREDIIRIYRQAFEQAPYFKSAAEVSSFRQSLIRHLKRPGFHFMIAKDPQTSQHVGFAYGYSGQSGQWWHDIVANAMSSETAALWMADNFELVELAVMPAYQGHGIGGALHDRLLIEQNHPKAVLSTLQSKTNALQLYQNRGWKILVNELRFPGSSRIYIIMGIALDRSLLSR